MIDCIKNSTDFKLRCRGRLESSLDGSHCCSASKGGDIKRAVTGRLQLCHSGSPKVRAIQSLEKYLHLETHSGVEKSSLS